MVGLCSSSQDMVLRRMVFAAKHQGRMNQPLRELFFYLPYNRVNSLDK